MWSGFILISLNINELWFTVYHLRCEKEHKPFLNIMSWFIAAHDPWYCVFVKQYNLNFSFSFHKSLLLPSCSHLYLSGWPSWTAHLTVLHSLSKITGQTWQQGQHLLIGDNRVVHKAHTGLFKPSLSSPWQSKIRQNKVEAPSPKAMKLFNTHWSMQ